MYLHFMKMCHTTEYGNWLTRNSLIVENLEIAADDPTCTHEIVGKIFEEIIQLGADGSHKPLPDESNFHLYDIAYALARGNIHQNRLEWIQSGFAALCS
jgi:hypothetical protein